MTGEPQLHVFSRALAKHIVNYCLSASSIKSIRDKEGWADGNITDAERTIIEAEIQYIARDYFRKTDIAGELGELLLFFIIESVFKAPQVVAKMELKTSAGDELKRSDGIHFGWDAKTNQCIVYLGESKLYGDVSAAVRDAVASIEKLFLANEHQEEIRLFTSHFKHLDDEFKNAVIKWTNRELGTDEYRLVQVCLLGYDWQHYKLFTTAPASFVSGFSEELSKELPRIVSLIEKHLNASQIKHLEFEFILFPFPSVDAFRNQFYRQLSGMNQGEQEMRKERDASNRALANALKKVRALEKELKKTNKGQK